MSRKGLIYLCYQHNMVKNLSEKGRHRRGGKEREREKERQEMKRGSDAGRDRQRKER